MRTDQLNNQRSLTEWLAVFLVLIFGAIGVWVIAPELAESKPGQLNGMAFVYAGALCALCGAIATSVKWLAHRGGSKRPNRDDSR